MKKYIIVSLFFTSSLYLKGQVKNIINTAVPFINLPTDAKSGGMAETGVSTAPNVYSQNWNASKYAFIKESSGLGFSYSPWINEDLKGTFLGHINYFNKIGTSSTWAASFKYFSLGNIEKIDLGTDGSLENSGEFKPREMTFDVSYSMRLGPSFSLGVALRYIHSNITDRTIDGNEGYSPVNSFGLDISGFYTKKLQNKNTIRAGLNISNLGPGVTYGNIESYNALPSNLRMGASYDFIIGFDSKLTVALETNKLLVPTPNNNTIDGTVTAKRNETSNIFSDIASSLYEAPNGFGEKIQEFTLQTGVEYSFKEKFFFRGGYFYENPNKGFRKYINIGFGMVYNNSIDIDISYLYSISEFQSPLDNGLRLSLSLNLDKFSILD